MTIHFVSCNFMVGLLLENKTAAEAADKIQHLKYVMEEHVFDFGNVIPFLLTDNGGEFSALSAFENDAKGNLETRMFFASLGGSIRKTSYRKEPYAL